VVGMDAETTAASGGSVRACDADDDSGFVAPAVVGRLLLLDPGLPSRVEGTLKLNGEELAGRERKDWELCWPKNEEEDVGGARKDWLESRKEWLLAGRGCGWVPPPPASALQSLYMRVSVPS